MPAGAPQIVVIGGPNGAGKTTIASEVLDKTLGITEFVNADTIAAGLSAFDPERAAFAAGRVMLARLHELATARESFAFESTLASRTFAPWLARLIDSGYRVDLLYVWLRSPELAIRRVAARVRKGGHSISQDVVRRRYARSAANFLDLYCPLAERSKGAWRVFDNSSKRPLLVARGGLDIAPIISQERAFEQLKEIANGVRKKALGDKEQIGL